MKKGVLAVAVASVLVGGCLAGCGGDDGGKVKIEFWGWGDKAEQDNYQTLVNQFMQEPGNEDIDVSYSGQDAKSYMLALEGRASSPPDLFMLPDEDFYGWVADDTLKDISDYVSDEELATIWPQAVNEYYFNPKTLRLGKGDGAKLYGLPKDLGPFTLVYNKTLLDGQIAAKNLNKDDVYAKLDPQSPMSWAEFRQLLKDLMFDNSGSQPANRKYSITHYELNAAVYSNNANYFDEEAAVSKINDQAFIDALQFIVDLDKVDGSMTPVNEQDVDGFTRFSGGSAIFSFMGPWDSAQFWSFESVNFPICLLPVPYGPGGDGQYGTADDGVSTTWVGSMAYCVGKGASNKKTEAAIKLAKYLSFNEKAQRKFYELGQQVPNIVSMAQNEYLNDTEGLLNGKDPADRSVWVNTISGANPKIKGKTRPTYYTYSSTWYGNFTKYLGDEGLWTGTKTAQQICTAYHPQLQKVLTQMREDDLGL